MGCSAHESKFGFSFRTPYLFDRKRDAGGRGSAGGAAPPNMNTKKRCGGRGRGAACNVPESEFLKQRTGCSAPEFLRGQTDMYLFRGEVTDRPGIFSQ
eukprot:scaffold4609_cov32-Cyclotella_meneghiniana.AAC.1